MTLQENSLIVSLKNNHLIIIIIIKSVNLLEKKKVQSENFINKLWQTAKKECFSASKSLCQSI